MYIRINRLSAVLPLVMKNSLPAFVCGMLLVLLLFFLLPGCSRGMTDGKPAPADVPIATPIPAAEFPPAEDPNQASTANSTPAAPEPAVPAPISSLPATKTDPSELPPIPLAMRWRYDAARPITDFALTSLDGGPLPDLVVGSEDGGLTAIGLAQNEYWRLKLPAPVRVVLGADLDGDGVGEVIVGGEDGRLLVTSGGQTRWVYEAGGMITAVLRQESTGSLAVAAGLGELLLLNRNGQEQWRLNLGDMHIATLAQADLTGDGRAELLAVNSRGVIFAISATPEIMWTAETGSPIRQLVTPDFNLDSAAEVVVGTAAGEVWAFASTGSPLWRQPLDGPVPALVAADLTGSGAPEIVAGDAGGTVTALAGDGAVLWRSRHVEGAVWTLAAGDVDGNGRPDLILGSDDGQIVALDAAGGFRGRFIAAGPVFALRLADMDQGATSPRPELLARAGHSIYLLDTLGVGVATADPDLAVRNMRPDFAAVSPAELPSGGGVTLLALGDLTLGSSQAERRFVSGEGYLLEGVRPVLETAVYTFANLDTVLSLRGVPADKDDLRCADPALVDLLQGVNLVFLANDHILDYGLTGLNDTLETLISRNIAFTGVGANLASATSPATFNLGGQKIAFLAFTAAAPADWYATEERFGVAPADPAIISAAVAQAQAAADLVVVALHGPPRTHLGQAQAALAAAAVDAGAALVIGYGAENALRAETYKDGLILHGLGYALANDSAVFRVAVSDTGFREAELLLTAVDANGTPRFLAGNAGETARLAEFPVAASGSGGLLAGDLPYYDFVVDLGYGRKTAGVSQTVILANDSRDNWAEVVFHVAPAYWGEMLALRQVTVTLGSDVFPVTPSRDLTMLRVPLPRLLAPGEAVAVSFAYTLTLPRLDPSGWGPEGNAGWGPSLIQMGDWYPALINYVSGEGWQTWRYWPVGDPVISRLADFAVQINSDPGVVVAAPGLVAGTTNRYRLEQARAFAFLASPEYVRFNGLAQDIPISVYVTRANQPPGPVLVQTIEQAITLFTDLFGPYPYEEFVLAENGFLTAMEYSAIVSLSGFAFSAYEGTAESLLVAITAHEVAHQWWYGSVGNDQVNEPWLDEALAMMSELLFYERYYPILVDWWWAYRVDRWEPAGPVDVTIYEHETSEAFVHNMYGQAVRFLAALRGRMGDAAFSAFLRTYYQQNALKFATRADLFAAVQASTAVDIADLVEAYFRD